MRDLNVSDLVDRVDSGTVEKFVDGIDSKMRVKTDYQKDAFDKDWLDLFEFTMPYLDKIVRNPKRFIVNEEEVMKVEQTKKIGMETIKHLAKHTNLVQDVDEDTGDIIPSKLLNVFKEETFNTYENRFIYTLIHYMVQFIKIKKEGLIKDPRLKDDKFIDYESTTKVGEENVSVKISLKSTLDTSLNKDPNYNKRIEKLEIDIKSLQNSEVYKALEKEDVAFVTNPIRKTNVILKNVSFQYAMKLWNYINQHITDKDETKKEQKDYYDEGKMKGLIDETFLLDYLTISSLNKEEDSDEVEAAKEKTISRMLDKIIDLNPELTKQQLQNKLGEKFDKIKTVKMSSKKDIEKIFRKYLDRYLDKISNFSI